MSISTTATGTIPESTECGNYEEYNETENMVNTFDLFILIDVILSTSNCNKRRGLLFNYCNI